MTPAPATLLRAKPANDTGPADAPQSAAPPIAARQSAADMGKPISTPPARTAPLRAGDWVEVRSKAEILATLDRAGRLEGMPLMPQMLKYSGQRFKIFKSAHKTCDPVHGAVGRALPDGIHLDLRCDGADHGGCQHACLIFWKSAWLKPVAGPDAPAGVVAFDRTEARASAGCTETDVRSATRNDVPGDPEPRYSCQTTELPTFTRPLPWWDARQYVQDYTSGNTTAWRMFCVLVYAYIGRPFARRFAAAREAYDRLQALWGGVPFPRRRSTKDPAVPMPTSTLDLQPGELVRVRSYEDILATLDKANNNKGLFFDAEMVPFCGKTYRVKLRVDRFLDENTGKIRTLKTPAVILENVWCKSRYSECRMLCPRSIYSWWREVWLERVEPAAASARPEMAAVAQRAKELQA